MLTSLLHALLSKNNKKSVSISDHYWKILSNVAGMDLVMLPNAMIRKYSSLGILKRPKTQFEAGYWRKTVLFPASIRR